MSAQSNQLGQKIILGSLFTCIVVLTGFTYYNYQESADKVSFLEKEKSLIINDLNVIKADLDSLSAEAGTFKTNVEASKARISRLLDSLKTVKVDYDLLHRYRKELMALREDNYQLQRISDSITQRNLLLTKEIDSANLKLVEALRYGKSLEKTNEQLSKTKDSIAKQNDNLYKKIKKEATIRVAGLEATSYTLRKNGKLTITNRANKSNRLRACFNIVPNSLIEAGDQVFYLQFSDPKNHVIGGKNETYINGKLLIYSKMVIINYKNSPLSVCDYIIPETTLPEGNYQVNLFNNEYLLASTSFSLK